jgi:hypothetical protein
MPNHRRLRKNPQPDRCHSSDAAPAYAVGYGRPPKHTQFKPGQCPNPKGRPKGRLKLETEFNNELSRSVTIREGDRSRRLKKRVAWFRKTINGALNNDAKANITLLALLRAFGPGQPPEESPKASLDLKKLSDEDLVELERIMIKGGAT